MSERPLESPRSELQSRGAATDASSTHARWSNRDEQAYRGASMPMHSWRHELWQSTFQSWPSCRSQLLVGIAECEDLAVLPGAREQRETHGQSIDLAHRYG